MCQRCRKLRHVIYEQVIMDPVYNNAALGTSAAAYKTRPSSKTHSTSYSQQTPAMLMLSAQRSGLMPEGAKTVVPWPGGQAQIWRDYFFLGTPGQVLMIIKFSIVRITWEIPSQTFSFLGQNISYLGRKSLLSTLPTPCNFTIPVPLALTLY